MGESEIEETLIKYKTVNAKGCNVDTGPVPYGKRKSQV